jgi:ABC-2 type transport system ATP-binding protein
MNPSAAISVSDLCKTYRDGLLGRKKIEALQGVSLDVERGEIFGLLGPNGAGKTTLIKILLGIVRKTSGQATLLGRPAGDRQSRRKVGYLPESHRIPHHLTGNTALEYYGQLSGLSLAEIKRKRPPLLDLVGLDKWGKTSVKKYSKGMQQRLGLAQAMLHDPDLLILDEPTDGVDPVGRSEIRDILHRLKAEGKMIFLNSHLLQEIELVCDRVAILVGGRVRRLGRIEDITEELTQRAGTDVQFSLEGDEPAIRAAFQSREILSFQPAGTKRYQVAVRLADQPELDRCIDALRTAGISIYAVARRRFTLEQAFLELVK